MLRRLNPALLVTYNWGAIEWALAAAFTKMPYVHVVDGFGPEEAKRQLTRRVLFRRLALARCSRIVVPSEPFTNLFGTYGGYPTTESRIFQMASMSTGSAASPMSSLLSALGIPRDRLIVGTVATLRPEKNITRLLHAFAQVKEQSAG